MMSNHFEDVKLDTALTALGYAYTPPLITSVTM
jgi:hypothetical protein